MADPATTNITPTANSTEDQPANFHILVGFWIFQLVYTFFVAIATVLINGLTLYAIYKDPLRCFRNPLAIFVTGVVAADFLTGLFGEPLLVAGTAHEWRVGNQDGLKVLFLGITAMLITITVSFQTLLALAVCQLLAIGWMRRYERCVSVRSARIGVILVWVFALIITVVLMVWNPLVAIGLTGLEMTLITITLVVIYIVSYHVFRKRVSQQENPLETQLVTKEFMKGTLLLVLVQIVTVWPYIACIIAMLIATPNQTAEEMVNIGIVNVVFTVLFLTKFVVDPLILVWRIPKYRRSMKIVYARCLGCCGCAVDIDTEGRAEYNETRRDDLDDNSVDNAKVEVM